ncbi:MAG: hypothetical protein IKR57_01805 [Bacilli bacterium]|nr:hypothetical protein [Bacilli bacterium]
MKINNNEINIDDLISEKYMHKEINKGIFLSDYQIEILMRNNINPYKCGSINDLIFQIDEALDDEIDEELDIISKEIMEFNYYTNTNK